MGHGKSSKLGSYDMGLGRRLAMAGNRGRDQAEYFFANDRMHLCDDGYGIGKELLVQVRDMISVISYWKRSSVADRHDAWSGHSRRTMTVGRTPCMLVKQSG